MNKCSGLIGLAATFTVASSGLFADSLDIWTAEPLNTGIVSLFDMWRPLSVDESGTILTVKLPYLFVEEDIYFGAVSTGLCFGVVRDFDISGITTFEVLNQTGDQGWVFEGGTEKCDIIIRATGNESRALVSAQTRVY